MTTFFSPQKSVVVIRDGHKAEFHCSCTSSQHNSLRFFKTIYMPLNFVVSLLKFNSGCMMPE